MHLYRHDEKIKKSEAEDFAYISSDASSFVKAMITDPQLSEVLKGKIDTVFVDLGMGGAYVISQKELADLKEFLAEDGRIFLNYDQFIDFFDPRSDKEHLADIFDVFVLDKSPRSENDWLNKALTYNHKYEDGTPKPIWKINPAYVINEVNKSPGKKSEILARWTMTEDEFLIFQQNSAIKQLETVGGFGWQVRNHFL